MGKTFWTSLFVAFVGAAVAAFVLAPVAAGGELSKAKCAKAECHQKCVKDLTSALTAIDDLSRYIKAGDKDKALAELQKVTNFVNEARQGITRLAKAPVVNGWDPIMGKAFDPYNVPSDRIREFNGHRLGFWSADTAKQWDKLSIADRQKDFDRVMFREGHAMVHPKR